ncbi:MAG TPA: VTT domain-containing protein [Bryobacteraceae bacterium]|nr:VTT domain-containing protein [Bryobacteraceae bacterium]
MKQFLAGIFAALLSWGPWGALVLALLDSAGIPVPEGVDVLLTVMAVKDVRAAYFGAALSVAGSLAGSIILFYIGRKGGEEFLNRRTQTGWPKRFRRWFHHYGGLTVFIPTLIPAPLPLKIFVLSAGALDMRLSHFALLVLAARIPRYFGLVYLASEMSTNPVDYLKRHVFILLAIAFLLFAALYVLVKLKDRAHARRPPGPPATIE